MPVFDVSLCVSFYFCCVFNFYYILFFTFQQDLKNRLKARSMAVKGNELAFQCQYQDAIGHFTEAIKYDKNDFKFYGNRSYCYDKLCSYEK